MVVHEIHDLSDAYVLNLLQKGLSDVTDEKLKKNYNPEDSDYNGNLFFILKNGRYRKGYGKYYVVENQGQYVCSAGWNEYEDDPDTALALTRMYVSPEYRGKYFVEKFILKKTLVETRKYKKVWLTVNENNKTIYTWFLRAENKKATALFNDWPETYRLFKPIGVKTVYNTTQYVMELRRNFEMTAEEKMKILIEGIETITKSSSITSGQLTITEETLLETLNLDSLDLVELMMFYEEKTGISIPDPESRLTTVGELIKLLP